MSSEQSIKDLQAQNAQFQQLFITLAKGQEDLKDLILKEKEKKKKKKLVGALNMGRRFRGALKQSVDVTSSSKEGEIKRGRQGKRTPVMKSLTMIPTTMMSSILLLRIDTSSWKIV